MMELLCIEPWFIVMPCALAEIDRTVHHKKRILLHVKKSTGCERKDGMQIVTNALNLL